MNNEKTIERLFEALVNGDRDRARAIVQETIDEGIAAEDLLTEIIYPTYETVEKLHRADQMSTLAHHFATRLLRVLADQAATRLERQPAQRRSIFAVCGPTDADELAAQIAVDLLEREGFDITYSGGGIAGDEVMAHVQRVQPDILLLFASAPQDLPVIRAMIDSMGEIGAARKTQIVVGGGVFNRAEGLAEEIGADLWATDPTDLVIEITENPERRASPDQHTVGRKRNLRIQAA